MSQTRSALTAAAAPGQHLLVTVELRGGHATILDSRIVPESLPANKAPRALPWQVVLKDAAGQELFAAEVPAGNALHAELQGGAGSPPEHAHVQVEDFAVALRVPVIASAVSIELRAAPTSLTPRARASATGIGAAGGPVRLFEVGYPAVQP